MNVESQRLPFDPSKEKYASAQLVGEILEGEKKNRWSVIERKNVSKNDSAGNFSVAYIVENEKGEIAFLKASDAQLINHSANMGMKALQHLMDSHKFECAILDLCRGSNMDKIVHAIDSGGHHIINDGVRETVAFIVFENAESDIRKQVTQAETLDFAWTLNAMHNLATAGQQLHNQSIAHNDIKPSNLLVFDNESQKLCDMGRATCDTINGPFDAMPTPGDQRFTSPEQLYRCRHNRYWGVTDTSIRKAADLYTIGSMGYYFVTGTMLTPKIIQIIDNEQVPHNWNGTFDEVLAVWVDAFGEAMLEFDELLPKDQDGELLLISKEFSTSIRQLCNPDPARRGHPKDRRNNEQNYSLEKYISTFIQLFYKFQIVKRKENG